MMDSPKPAQRVGGDAKTSSYEARPVDNNEKTPRKWAQGGGGGDRGAGTLYDRLFLSCSSLLVTPYLPMKISLIALNARYTHSCPALFYLRNLLARELPESEISLQQRTINDPYYETLLGIAAMEPDILCFSVSIWNVTLSRALIADLRRLLPRVPIVLGGPEASFMAAESLPAGCTLVRGEAEGLPAHFFRDLAAGRLLPEYRAEPGRPFALPYRSEDFADHLANRNIYYESARGCPFACSYCLSSVERGVRLLDLAQVRAELAEILRHRPRIVRFVDRTFNADPDRALAIWRFLLEQAGETRFHFEIAPDRFNEELLAFLKEVPAGRFQFEIGLQSTHAPTLAAVNRRMDLARAREHVATLAGYDNIHLHLDLILGLPFETEESFRASLNEAFAMAPHYLQMGLLKCLPGTPLSRQQEEFGILCSLTPPYSVLATRWLPQRSLARLHLLGECLEAFYNNRFFRTLFRYLREKGEEPFAFFCSLLDCCLARDFFSLARTQELLARMLSLLADRRQDREFVLEILRFDWLGSGQRVLPPFLEGEPLREARDLLWRSLPESCPPHFSASSRSGFFKRAIFCRFSGELLRLAGLADGAAVGYLCFLPEEKGGSAPRRQLLFFV